MSAKKKAYWKKKAEGGQTLMDKEEKRLTLELFNAIDEMVKVPLEKTQELLEKRQIVVDIKWELEKRVNSSIE
jgi:hypothetical protein